MIACASDRMMRSTRSGDSLRLTRLMAAETGTSRQPVERSASRQYGQRQLVRFTANPVDLLFLSEDRRERRLPFQHGDGVTRRQIGHRGASLGCGAAKMGRQYDILEQKEIRMNLRLALIDVERRP